MRTRVLTGLCDINEENKKETEAARSKIYSNAHLCKLGVIIRSRLLRDVNCCRFSALLLAACIYNHMKGIGGRLALLDEGIDINSTSANRTIFDNDGHVESAQVRSAACACCTLSVTGGRRDDTCDHGLSGRRPLRAKPPYLVYRISYGAGSTSDSIRCSHQPRVG